MTRVKLNPFTSSGIKKSSSGSMLMFIFIAFITGLDGLRDVRLEGPRFVRLGEDVVIHCNYKLDNDSIYVVKWYRGSDEFYRFLPKEFPPKLFFQAPGLSFNEQYCNEHDIFLRNVSLETSGKFKCSVSAEVTFQTFTAIHDLTVVSIDYIPPRIAVEQASYYPGDSAKANCSVDKVSHPLNFTWYINGYEVPKSMHKEISLQDSENSALVTSISVLQFEMGANVNSVDGKGGKGGSLNGDDTRLQCKAELYSDLYVEISQEIVIQTTQPRYSQATNQETLRRASAAINVSNRGASTTPKELGLSSWSNLILLMLFSTLMGTGSAFSLPSLFVTTTPTNYFHSR